MFGLLPPPPLPRARGGVEAAWVRGTCGEEDFHHLFEVDKKQFILYFVYLMSPRDSLGWPQIFLSVYSGRVLKQQSICENIPITVSELLGVSDY